MTQRHARKKSLRRAFLNLLGAVPQEDIAYLTDRIRGLESSQRYNNSVLMSTGSQQSLSYFLDAEFTKLERESLAGEDTAERKQKLLDPIKDYFTLPSSLPSIHFSPGAQSGSRRLEHFRIKQVSEPLANLEESCVQCIAKTYPERVMFTTAIGQYLVARNFDGEQLAKLTEGTAHTPAFQESVTRAHLGFLREIGQVDFSAALRGHALSSERYRAKMLESLAGLADAFPFTPEALEVAYRIACECQDQASVPLYDGHPENLKFDREGNLKRFDFSKMIIHAIDGYEITQTRLWQNSSGHGLTGLVQKIEPFEGMGNSRNEELGAAYFLLRQLYRSAGILHESARFDAYRNALAHAKFNHIPEANCLAQIAASPTLAHTQ